jgi:hypothetical protein
MAFTFPMDTYSRAGAVRVTPDGNNFYTPAVIFGPDGVTPISSTNPLPVQMSGRLTQLDSTTTALAANASYTTASAFSLSGFDKIVGSVFADQAGTLFIEQSWDGTNWDIASTVNVTASPAAWATSTSYTVGQQVIANGNVYQCKTAGTSASTGSGPSGTGTSITDGTAVWQYVSPASGQGFSIDVVAPNGRLVYVNGATAQTKFRLYAGGKTL